MIDNKTPHINPDYTVEQFEDEILLYTATGSKAVYLNEVAYAVWILCKEDITVGQMIAFFEERYPDQAGQIRNDVINAIQTMAANKVIELRDAK